jgi:ribonuclease BN (tRNA processing enzyme)
VVALAARAKARNLIPIHFHPKWSEEMLLSNLRKFDNGKVTIIPATDGKIITCDN